VPPGLEDRETEALDSDPSRSPGKSQPNRVNDFFRIFFELCILFDGSSFKPIGWSNPVVGTQPIGEDPGSFVPIARHSLLTVMTLTAPRRPTRPPGWATKRRVSLGGGRRRPAAANLAPTRTDPPPTPIASDAPDRAEDQCRAVLDRLTALEGSDPAATACQGHVDLAPSDVLPPPFSTPSPTD